MRVIIRDDYEAVCAWVALYVKNRILSFKPTAKRPFVMGLPTGSTPIGIYKRFVQMYKAKELSFQHVITFNMDEYVQLPTDHSQSYHSFMWENLFKHIDILPSNAHILNGNASDLAKECADYEAAIKAVGGIELFLGGVGHDGHMAFNEPASSLTSRTRVKTLAYETIVANARFFDNNIERVPKMALTVGVGTIMDAREVLIVVTGNSKAAALAKCMEEGVNHMYTMSALQMHAKACIVCDEDATGELRVRTVKYFKGLEKVHDELLSHPIAGHLSREDEKKQAGTASAAAPATTPNKKQKTAAVTASTAAASSSSTAAAATSASDGGAKDEKAAQPPVEPAGKSKSKKSKSNGGAAPAAAVAAAAAPTAAAANGGKNKRKTKS